MKPVKLDLRAIAYWDQVRTTVTTEPCGCIVTRKPGHTNTKLCNAHYLEVFPLSDLL